MAELELRPRFILVTTVEPNDVLRRLAAALRDRRATVAGRVFTSSAVLRMKPSATHFWSPQLQVSIDPHLPSGGSLVTGLFGPRPAVWALFVALYVAIGFATAMGLIFGYSQIMLGQPGTALWAGPLGLVLAGIVYIVGRTGRRLGTAQMHQLREFLETALGESFRHS